MHMATLDGTAPPPSLLSSVVDAGWDSVGGHADVVRQLKEMVMLPLLYPELLREMHITAPRCVRVRRQCRSPPIITFGDCQSPCCIQTMPWSTPDIFAEIFECISVLRESVSEIIKAAIQKLP